MRPRKAGLTATFTSGGGPCDLGQPWGQSRPLSKHSFHGAATHSVPRTALTSPPPAVVPTPDPTALSQTFLSVTLPTCLTTECDDHPPASGVSWFPGFGAAGLTCSSGRGPRSQAQITP